MPDEVSVAVQPQISWRSVVQERRLKRPQDERSRKDNRTE